MEWNVQIHLLIELLSLNKIRGININQHLIIIIYRQSIIAWHDWHIVVNASSIFMFCYKLSRVKRK